MPKTITDKWPIRYMRLDDEVYAAVMKLKEKYGSPNKGLRAVLISNDAVHDGGSDRTVRASIAPVKELKVEYDG